MTDVSSAPADAIDRALLDCADEPIRVPGSVQPHGVLLAADPATGRVVVASRSVGAHLGRTPDEVLGRTLTEVLGEGLPDLPPGDEPLDPQPVDVTVAGRAVPFEALVHRSDGLLVVELEPRGEVGGEAALRRVRPALRALQRAGTPDQVVRLLVQEVRRVTGFDRVMVYRFDERWNGEVVAEDAHERLEPFLGLHYPASDIPAQARALYTTQWLRSIPDATYTPSPLVPPLVPATGAPLDLSGSALRSVSPVHLEYLANMGVRASMSVSIIVHGRLWGLVACHHYAGPHFPSPSQRAAAEFLGRTGSLLLQGKADEARYVDSMALAATSAELARALSASGRDPLAALTRDDVLLDLVEGSTGCAVRVNGQLRLLGDTPSASDVDALVDLLWQGRTGTLVTSSLVADHPGSALADRLVPVASGVLGVRPTAASPRDVLLWFRPEVLKEVHWAGDPGSTGIVPTAGGLRLTPRASFAAWVEEVRGTSETWDPAQVHAVEALARDVDEALVRQRSEDERVAATLQRVVLAHTPVLPDGYALARHYQPSGTDVLGGDWYDVVPLPDGRTVLVVGDVAGHGISVAAITAQVRHALRAFLVDEGTAQGAFARLNQVLADLVPGELATVVAVELEPSSGRARVTRAGHVPPLLVAADGARYVLGATGAALGVADRDGRGFRTADVDLASGDCLLLYTDGLVEERGSHLAATLERMRGDAERLGRDREGLAAGLVAAAVDGGDDVTALVLQRL
ncbi:SpoIIE family protein phosphatase [Cellulomonas endophytica]|uniref:SpoIIE family protein phosphatase n=1 Tax=Cellulomonas endophytica TaxID=2494735 RepID=UPI0013E920BA|nr:SpoIIE family protein phosphatase [Cellulomonas endophytica]